MYIEQHKCAEDCECTEIAVDTPGSGVGCNFCKVKACRVHMDMIMIQRHRTGEIISDSETDGD